MFGYIHNAPHDFFRYTRFGLRNLAKDSGYEVLELKPMGEFFTFLGYVRSTILTPLYGIPLFGTLILYLNYFVGRIKIAIDKLIPKDEDIFALNYMVILEKTSELKEDS